jgi:hypothetical protein
LAIELNLAKTLGSTIRQVDPLRQRSSSVGFLLTKHAIGAINLPKIPEHEIRDITFGIFERPNLLASLNPNLPTEIKNILRKECTHPDGIVVLYGTSEALATFNFVAKYRDELRN